MLLPLNGQMGSTAAPALLCCGWQSSGNTTAVSTHAGCLLQGVRPARLAKRTVHRDKTGPEATDIKPVRPDIFPVPPPSIQLPGRRGVFCTGTYIGDEREKAEATSICLLFTKPISMIYFLG